jgi:hypothetical protein
MFAWIADCWRQARTPSAYDQLQRAGREAQEAALAEMRKATPLYAPLDNSDLNALLARATQTATELQESIMATAPVTPAPPAPVSTENGFERFIDKLESFVSAELPIVVGAAVAAEPILALTPIGPEYALVVTAIAAAEKASAAFRSKTGVSLTGKQKMSLVVQATTPGLAAILTEKGVTDTAIPTAINQFAQNVYNLQTGPAAAPPAPAAS